MFPARHRKLSPAGKAAPGAGAPIASSLDCRDHVTPASTRSDRTA